MVAKKDYYEILGVAKEADEGEIKRAYRKLARKHHPDVNPGNPDAEERFKEIAEAYHVVGDAERRAAYDRGPEQFAQEFDLSDFLRQFGQGFDQGGASFGGGGFGDLFDVFAGAGGPRGRGQAWTAMRPGRDIEVSVSLTFEEAVEGVQKTVRYRLEGPDGHKDVSTKVKIPAGVDNGKRIRVAGRGEPGLGGAPPGDLYLRVDVAPHRLFRRDGRDLHLDLPVTVYEAGLGATIQVPTLNGATSFKLPPRTRNGQRFRLAGKGLPRRGARGGGKAGDLFVTIKVELPRKIDAAAEQLLHRFREDHPYDPRQHLK